MRYIVKRSDTLSKIADRHNISLTKLLAANPQYKADPNRLNVGDELDIPVGKPTPAVKRAPTTAPSTPPSSQAPSPDDAFIVPFGQLTFDAEGQEKLGIYFSRIAHVPSGSSGVTIGRGYDMKERSQNEIADDLAVANVPQKLIRKFQKAAGFKGKRAKQFIEGNNLAALEITPQQQKELFLIVYKELEGDVIRICTKQDVVHKYGDCGWENLHPAIRDLVVDLRYRGDYTPATRQVVQPLLVENSLRRLTRLMAKAEYWRDQIDVPKDRFERRMKYMQKA